MTTLNTLKGRDWLVSHLATGPVRIQFVKQDGSIRTMNCTLKEDLLVYEEKKTERVKSHNPETLSVYDLDVKGWRSFKLANVTTISFDL